jgi:hypothetical protein
MNVLLWLIQCLRAHPHVEQHNCDECIEFSRIGGRAAYEAGTTSMTRLNHHHEEK